MAHDTDVYPRRQRLGYSDERAMLGGGHSAPCITPEPISGPQQDMAATESHQREDSYAQGYGICTFPANPTPALQNRLRLRLRQTSISTPTRAHF